MIAAKMISCRFGKIPQYVKARSQFIRELVWGKPFELSGNSLIFQGLIIVMFHLLQSMSVKNGDILSLVCKAGVLYSIFVAKMSRESDY